ncbi:MAG: tripartite tricarboxylate transporter TctB family protein [Burkholderiales bacterium]|nr:tripartite tricarboxylate transporter TctB family protein [Burkholderiales bacterium]
MKRAHRIAGVAFLLLAAWTMWESLGLKFYTPLGPGPGFFPFWVALALGTLAGCMIWQAGRAGGEALPADFFPDRDGRRRAAAIVIALAGAIALMEALGFRLTMLAFFLFLLPALGERRPLVILAIALAGSVGAYHLFDSVLQVPLPAGRVGA